MDLPPWRHVTRAIENRVVRVALLILLLAACSKPRSSPDSAATADPRELGAEDLRAAAQTGQASAQRELAGRLLFGQGMDADPGAAAAWAERAALGGDETAAVWMGRRLLNEPPDRIAAAAWFMVAAASTNPSVRQDANGELAALTLSAEEQAQAAHRSAELKPRQPRGSE